VTIADLSEYWMVSRKQIYKQIESGALHAIRLGPRLLRVSKADAIEFERVAQLPRSHARMTLPSHAAIDKSDRRAG
jgi:excisionase family DNA binding protein